MTIQELHIKFKNLVNNEEIFLCEKYNNHGLFLVFRESNSGQLDKGDEDYLMVQLQDENEKWFVPHVLRVISTFSQELMVASLEAAIKTKDPSFNNNFLQPCIRVYDLKVNDYLNTRFLSSNKKDRVGILKAFYWVRDRRRQYINLKGETTEAFGAIYIWEEDSFTDRSKNKIRMSDDEYNSYCKKANSMNNQRLKLLLDALYKAVDLEMKYSISLCLPKEINQYPEYLRKHAQSYINQKHKIPKNIMELERLQKVKLPIFRNVVMIFINWKNRRSKKKGFVTLKNKG